MRLTLISKHFYPEEFFINNIVKELQDVHNFQILTYTSYPYYNYNTSRCSTYKSKEFISNIVRVGSFIPKNKKVVSIFLNYITFIISLSLRLLRDRKKLNSNLVFVFATSPLYQAIPALILKKFFNKKVIIWVQDLWPEILIDHKYIRKNYLKSFLYRVSYLIYKNSDLILTQNHDAETYLKKKYDIKKIITHYNPAYSRSDKFINIAKEIDVFKVAYTGNIGMSQNLLNIITKISKSKLNFVFYIVGEGSEKKSLQKYIYNNNLEKKFIIKNSMNKKDLDEFIQKLDGLFISLIGGISLSKTIPGKFPYYLSKGLPIFSTSDGVTNNFIKNKNLGVISSSQNHKELLNNFEKFINLEFPQRNLISNNCKKLYFKYFEFNKNVSRLKSILESYA